MAKPYLLLPFQWTITVVSYFFARSFAPLSAVGRSMFHRLLEMQHIRGARE